MSKYISKIMLPGGTEAYLIKDSEGRLMIAPAYNSSTTYAAGDYYVNDGKLYVVNSDGATETTVGAELKAIKQLVSGSMHYIGVTSTVLTDGSTTATLIPESAGSLTKTSDFAAGDVVLAPAPQEGHEKYYEYVWNGNIWSEFGSTTALGTMAYANSATGSTSVTVTHNKYTGSVKVNDYTEAGVGYIKPATVITDVTPTGATFVTGTTTTTKKIATKQIDAIAANTTKALDSVDVVSQKLVTTTVTGVDSTTLEASKVELSTTNKASKVTVGSTTVNVGASTTTAVVTGVSMGTTGAADGTNPFTNAVVDADECLSWVSAPVVGATGAVREALESIKVQKVTAEDVNASDLVTVTGVTGIAKPADSATDVATGAIAENGEGASVATGVISTQVDVAQKAASKITVATGLLTEEGEGVEVVVDVTDSTSQALTQVTGTTGSVYGAGAKGDTGAVKFIGGITGTEAIKTLDLVGATAAETVTVNITVNPD